MCKECKKEMAKYFFSSERRPAVYKETQCSLCGRKIERANACVAVCFECRSQKARERARKPLVDINR